MVTNLVYCARARRRVLISHGFMWNVMVVPPYQAHADIFKLCGFSDVERTREVNGHVAFAAFHSILPLSHTSALPVPSFSSSARDATVTSYAVCRAPRAGSCKCHENLGAGSSMPSGAFRLSTDRSTGPVHASACNTLRPNTAAPRTTPHAVQRIAPLFVFPNVLPEKSDPCVVTSLACRSRLDSPQRNRPQEYCSA